MRRLLLVIAMMVGAVGLGSKPVAAVRGDSGHAVGDSRTAIRRVDPAFWYAGMVNTQLQLMVCGPDINYTELVGTDATGVQVTNVVHTNSPNYLLVYLDLSAAEPGHINLYFRRGKSDVKYTYELRRRQSASQMRQGFTPDDVMYLIMPDRFANGNPQNDVVKGMRDNAVNRIEPSMRHGGDLAGLRQNLDYIEDLGVTALWLTPVVENDMPCEGGHSSYHGYAATDYYRVDPRLGTNDDYRDLVVDCHARGLKVVMDMVFNHCGLCHPWCDDVPMVDWFTGNTRSHLQTNYRLTTVTDPYASRIDRSETVDGWFAPMMPDLNQRNPHVARYLVQVSKWWIETTGIDGIRMDTYPYSDREAMARWMKELHQEYPNLHVVGETWVGDPAYTASWQRNTRIEGQPDSHLDYVMDFALYDSFKAIDEETDSMFAGLNRVYTTLASDYLYREPSHVLAFLDNHDTDRFRGDLRQALTLLLTLPRTPQIYYGTEILMSGAAKITDGDVRRDFPGGWAGDKRNCFTPEGRTPEENAMHDFTRTLLHWRRGNPAVSRGTMTQFLPVKGVYAYARRYADRRFIVLLNGTSRAATADMARYAEVTGTVVAGRDVATGRMVPLTGTLELAPRESLIVEF